MKLQGLIFDWAGTAVDFGSQCPVLAFQQAFAQYGVELEASAIHRFMGSRKREHLLSMLALPEIGQQWIANHGAAPTDADVDSLYRATESLMIELAPQFARPVPGMETALQAIRQRDLVCG